MGLYGMSNLNAMVTVQNFGTDTVKRFTLTKASRTGGTSYCLLGLNKSYTVTIPPGGLVTVATGIFYGDPVSVSYGDSTFNYGLCIFASVPNAKSDVNTLNDGFCRTIKLVPVGIKENIVSDLRLQVFPNPTQNGFTITSPEAINSVHVTDISGRIVFETDPGTERLFIPSTGLVPGLYFIKVTADHRTSVRKVVIDK